MALAEFHLSGQLRQVRQQASQFEQAITAAEKEAAERESLEERSAGMGAMLAEIERVRGHNRAVREWLEQLPLAVPPNCASSAFP